MQKMCAEQRLSSGSLLELEGGDHTSLGIPHLVEQVHYVLWNQVPVQEAVDNRGLRMEVVFTLVIRAVVRLQLFQLLLGGFLLLLILRLLFRQHLFHLREGRGAKGGRGVGECEECNLAAVHDFFLPF